MPLMGNKQLLKQNLEYWLNDKFLKNGLYSNVLRGEVDTYGNNISLMSSQSDEDWIANQSWQSPFKNWVYESGISSDTSGIAPPSVASGVYVDGTFYPTSSTTGMYEHFIDYPNGRVVFSTALAGTPTVESDFSYKHVMIDFADKINNETMPLLIETSYKDNPTATGVDIYPTANSRTLPAVFIDIISSQSAGYELGSKSLVTEYTGYFHIWARDDFTRDLIDDILAGTARDVIFGVNYNSAPSPLLFRGRRNPLWFNFDAFSSRWGIYLWRRIYIESIESRKDVPLFEVERTRVKFRAKIYPNF